MAGELDFYGIYIPVILIQALLAYVIYSYVLKAMDKWQLDRWILLPTVFHLCLYIIVLGMMVWVCRLLF
ncbi:DUF1656 domain-containing protein [Alkanindiges sp. WGS2144]|uniref:DUF1656 domain-containing protein n=1 Tax=Alkanindiges sp. WGS2144 TaxID=3366808 RepID=UPI0037529180